MQASPPRSTPPPPLRGGSCSEKGAPARAVQASPPLRGWMRLKTLYKGMYKKPILAGKVSDPPTGDHKGPHPAPHRPRPYAAGHAVRKVPQRGRCKHPHPASSAPPPLRGGMRLKTLYTGIHKKPILAGKVSDPHHGRPQGSPPRSTPPPPLRGRSCSEKGGCPSEGDASIPTPLHTAPAPTGLAMTIQNNLPLKAPPPPLRNVTLQYS